MIYFLKIKQCDCTDNGKVLSWTVVTKSYNLHGQQHIPMTCLDATILYDQWLPGTSVPVFYKVLTGTCWLGRGICNSLSSTHPCMVFLVHRLNSGSLVNPADTKEINSSINSILTINTIHAINYLTIHTWIYTLLINTYRALLNQAIFKIFILSSYTFPWQKYLEMKERVSKLTYPTLQHCLRMLYTMNGNSKIKWWAFRHKT